MPSSIRRATLALFLILSGGLAPAAMAATCQNTGSFGAWLADFKKEALQQGISKRTLAAAEPYLTFDPGIIARDRKQSVFSQAFLEFAGRMVAPYRIQGGKQQIKKNAATFAHIEKEYGVPAPVIVAFWALESDFGANTGDFATLRSLASLAYDCRRPEVFRPQLMDALRIVERGDLSPDEMKGAWAGELGPTQFVPSHYWNYGVDLDGDGRVDMLHSVPDMLATSGNFLKGLGWKAGEPWLEEVKVPDELPWQEAELATKHPRSQWAKWGVRYATGKALPADDVPVALHLPMGRLGPAFLAYHNFDVYLEWNQSLVYATTAGYLATRIAGAPALNKGRGTVEPLNAQQVKLLQQLLVKNGLDVGEVDGKLGAGTRAAVKTMQIKLGLPADSYPTLELLDRLQGG